MYSILKSYRVDVSSGHEVPWIVDNEWSKYLDDEHR